MYMLMRVCFDGIGAIAEILQRLVELELSWIVGCANRGELARRCASCRELQIRYDKMSFCCLGFVVQREAQLVSLAPYKLPPFPELPSFLPTHHITLKFPTKTHKRVIDIESLILLA
jgi:hypothetical protein